MNSEKVETWHGIIISPTWHVKNSRGLRQKLDTLRVQTGQSLSKYEGFGRKNTSVTKALHFLNLLQLQTFLRSVQTIQSDVINFQNFLTSFAIFLVIYLFV